MQRDVCYQTAWSTNISALSLPTVWLDWIISLEATIQLNPNNWEIASYGVWLKSVYFIHLPQSYVMQCSIPRLCADNRNVNSFHFETLEELRIRSIPKSVPKFSNRITSHSIQYNFQQNNESGKVSTATSIRLQPNKLFRHDACRLLKYFQNFFFGVSSSSLDAKEKVA